MRKNFTIVKMSSYSKSASLDDPFSGLPEALRRYLRDQGWITLTPLQKRVIDAFRNEKEHFVVSSATGSGKTEAVYLPVAESLLATPSHGQFAVLSILPTRALINDQARRLKPLFQAVGVSVHPWHSDISPSEKQRAKTSQNAVLITTPESLEARFVSDATDISSWFCDLRYIVIDEFHQFLGTDRGRHLQSLLSRLLMHLRQVPRVIVLSATLPHEGSIAQFFHGIYTLSLPVLIKDSWARPISVSILSVHLNHADHEARKLIARFLLNHHRNEGNLLLFANSRRETEEAAAFISDIIDEYGLRYKVVTHHSSVGKHFRTTAEHQLREQTNVLCCATTTLEVGIDIGNITHVILYRPPASVSSFVQRAGRSARKAGVPARATIWVNLRGSQKEQPESILDLLEPELLQAIAIVELQREGFLEKPLSSVHVSVLIHQILSTLAESGYLGQHDLEDRLRRRGAFKDWSESSFSCLLDHLQTTEVIQRVGTSDKLSLSKKGEQIVRRKDFYAIFPTPKEWALFYKGTHVGSISRDIDPTKGIILRVAGAAWEVLAVDHDRGKLTVAPTRGGTIPKFPPSGVAPVSNEIMSKMKSVLLSAEEFDYVHSDLRTVLARARNQASNLGITKTNVVPSGTNHTLWFPWVGGKLFTTLTLLLNQHISEVYYPLAIEFSVPVQEFKRILDQASESLITLDDRIESFYLAKYDYLAPRSILEKQYRRDFLQENEALELLRNTARDLEG